MSNQQNTNGRSNAATPYTTALGKTIMILGVSPFEIEQVRATVPVPEVPKRKVETALPGYSEVEELNADNLTTDEERKEWADYVVARRTAEEQRNTLVANFIMVEGTTFEMDEMEAWTARRQRWNLPIPDDPIELRIAYFRTAIIGSVEDLNSIMGIVMKRQGVDEVTLKNVSATFQHTVRENANRATADAQREMELLERVPGSEGSALLGSSAT